MRGKTKTGRTALLALAFSILTGGGAAQAEVFVSVSVAPPPLPEYEQPPVPGPDYIWQPGYWAWDEDEYYWVPGVWVLAPEPEYYWTPGYWEWGNDVYVWHAGYWGPEVGFYGGVGYGYGYTGVGYAGGHWSHGAFNYNVAITNVNTTIIHNTYSQTIVNAPVVNTVSYNGGPGGLIAKPNEVELRAAHERHIEQTAEQRRHGELARHDHAFLASVNHGKPPVAASARAGQFSGPGVIAAKGAEPRSRGDVGHAFDSHHDHSAPGGAGGPHGGPHGGAHGSHADRLEGRRLHAGREGADRFPSGAGRGHQAERRGMVDPYRHGSRFARHGDDGLRAGGGRPHGGESRFHHADRFHPGGGRHGERWGMIDPYRHGGRFTRHGDDGFRAGGGRFHGGDGGFHADRFHPGGGGGGRQAERRGMIDPYRHGRGGAPFGPMSHGAGRAPHGYGPQPGGHDSGGRGHPHDRPRFPM